MSTMMSSGSDGIRDGGSDDFTLFFDLVLDDILKLSFDMREKRTSHNNPNFRLRYAI